MVRAKAVQGGSKGWFLVEEQLFHDKERTFFDEKQRFVAKDLVFSNLLLIFAAE